MTKITAIWIDSETRTTTMVDITPELKSYYDLIHTDVIDAVRLDNADLVYVDDEALLKNPKHFFSINGAYPPLAGNGVIVGTYDDDDEDNAGKDASCKHVIGDTLDVTFFTIA